MYNMGSKIRERCKQTKEDQRGKVQTTVQMKVLFQMQSSYKWNIAAWHRVTRTVFTSSPNVTED